jgi:hypothetical protein
MCLAAWALRAADGLVRGMLTPFRLRWWSGVKLRSLAYFEFGLDFAVDGELVLLRTQSVH